MVRSLGRRIAARALASARDSIHGHQARALLAEVKAQAPADITPLRPAQARGLLRDVTFPAGVRGLRLPAAAFRPAVMASHADGAHGHLSTSAAGGGGVGASASAVEVKSYAPTKARELQAEEGYIFIDVRTPVEFAQGHAEGAINIPVQMPPPGVELPTDGSHPKGLVVVEDFADIVKERFSQDAKLLTSCMYGRRGNLAAQILTEKGFPNVVDVKGGLNAWIESGLPSTKE